MDTIEKEAPANTHTLTRPAAEVAMHAVTFIEAGKTKQVTVKRPEPKANEVLIRLEGCGLCASSIPVWEGREWFKYPLNPGTPGHEGYGIVEETGGDVLHLRKGDRVAALSYHAFAEYDVAAADAVVKLPEQLKYMTFPGEALGCAMNIWKRSDVRKGHTVAIVGIGFLGALLIQLAKKAGATVIAISQRPFSLEVARQMGADEVLSMENRNRVIARVKELTDGNWCDRVIEATGKQSPLDLCGEIIANRGKLVIAGFHQDGLRNVNLQLWNWRGIDVVNAHERDPRQYVKGMEDAVAAVLDYRLDIPPLFTHYYQPDEISQAFEDLRTRPEGFIKGIVKF